MSKYPAIAHGGRLAAEVPGAVLHRSSVLRGESSLVLAGGADWVDAPRVCQGVNQRLGVPCESAPVKDSDYCLPHKRHADKVEQKAK